MPPYRVKPLRQDPYLRLRQSGLHRVLGGVDSDRIPGDQVVCASAPLHEYHLRQCSLSCQAAVPVVKGRARGRFDRSLGWGSSGGWHEGQHEGCPLRRLAMPQSEALGKSLWLLHGLEERRTAGAGTFCRCSSSLASLMAALSGDEPAPAPIPAPGFWPSSLLVTCATTRQRLNITQCTDRIVTRAPCRLRTECSKRVATKTNYAFRKRSQTNTWHAGITARLIRWSA